MKTFNLFINLFTNLIYFRLELRALIKLLNEIKNTVITDTLFFKIINFLKEREQYLLMKNLNSLRNSNNYHKRNKNPGNAKRVHKNKVEIKKLGRSTKKNCRLSTWKTLSSFSDCTLKFILKENKNGMAIISIFKSLYELSEHFQKRLEKLLITFELYSNIDPLIAKTKNGNYLFYYFLEWINHFFNSFKDDDDILMCSINITEYPKLPENIVCFIVILFKVVNIENDSFINSFDRLKLSQNIISVLKEKSFKQEFINLFGNIKNITIKNIKKKVNTIYKFRYYEIKNREIEQSENFKKMKKIILNYFKDFYKKTIKLYSI